MYSTRVGFRLIGRLTATYLATLPSVVSVCLRVREATGTYREASYKLPIDFGQVDVDVAVA